MSDDDVLFGFRLRLFSLAGEIGVRPACRAMGVHHSTYYRWKQKVDRWGLEALRVRERRPLRMPNALGPHLEQRILAFSLAHPGFGPLRISAELRRERWGGLRISPNGVWHCLRRHGLRSRRRAPSCRARAGAPRRGAASGRARRARLLLRRAPEWDEGCCLAVHGDRRRLRVCLGGACTHPRATPPLSTLGARQAGRL